MYYLLSVFVGYLCLVTTLAKNNTENSIGFPEVDDDVNSKNKDNRQPVYLPAQCPVNELFYPGDQKDDWICDCRPAYLYHPGSDSCWAAYKQGPCAYGEYLILPSDSVIPICVKNPCNVDSYVFYADKCHRLDSILPCMDLYPIAAALGVNSTTLNIECVRLNVLSRFGDEVTTGGATLVPCKPGSKLSVNGKCKVR